GASATLPVSIMEARNFVTAREMLTDGNWLLTTMNGEARYEKPPLPTMFSAISASIFGMSAFAMRLPALLMVILLGIFCNKISFLLSKDYKLSLLGSIITVSSFYVLAIVIEAPWDIYAHTFMTISLYFGLVFIQTTDLRVAAILGVILFAAGAFLSKGPIPYYALLLPFLISLIINYGGDFQKKRILIFFLLMLLGLAFGSLWYLYVRLEDPLTIEAIASKETSNWSSYNVRPFYYYWSFFTQSGLWTIPALMSLLYPHLKNKVKHTKYYKFVWWWTILAVIFLSVIPEKKSRYLMPVLIPLGLTISNYIQYAIDHGKKLNRLEKLPIYLHFGLITILALVLPIAIWFINSELHIDNYWLIFTSVIVLAIGSVSALYLVKFNVKQLTLLSIVFLMAIASTAPLILKSEDTNIAKAKESFRNLNESDENIYGLPPLSPEFIWYYGKKLPALNTKNLSNKEVLIISEYRNDIEKDSISKTFNMKLLETFDFNQTTDSSSSTYKKRLKAALYKISLR
ncbi:ArnT family glycosyltransferase, partial [Aegicerativicinus sediminis]